MALRSHSWHERRQEDCRCQHGDDNSFHLRFPPSQWVQLSNRHNYAKSWRADSSASNIEELLRAWTGRTFAGEADAEHSGNDASEDTASPERDHQILCLIDLLLVMILYCCRLAAHAVKSALRVLLRFTTANMRLQIF